MITNTFDVKYFVGVVEDRQDPMKLGRVRVRVYSLHTEQKHKDDQQGIPTEDLLWMYVIQPINSAAVSGVGFSPVGMVRGSHVFGLYLDKYYLNGVVLGTYGGVNSNLANTNQGFADPLGIYPKNTGVDTSDLAIGGISGDSDQSIVLQNRNLDIGVNPSDADSIPDDNPDYTALQMLERDEGVRNKLYWDTLGYPTIGIGHLIVREQTRDMNKISSLLSEQLGTKVYNEITTEQIALLFNKDYIETVRSISNHPLIGPIYNNQNESRKMALMNMAFQLGVTGLSKFTASLALIDQGRYKEAGVELRNSLWYNQTLGRATRVIRVIETGNLESYGVVPKAAEQSESLFSTFSTTSDDPSEPYTPDDSRIMFTEPESPYKGEYPYNKVHQTEGGHIFEIDDTPGHERIRNKHTAGTYEEIGPDGTKVTKVVKDNYTLIHGNDSVLVEGDLKLVVSKDSRIYIMGNVTQTIDGNVNQIIRGNNNSIIEGDSTELIKGNLSTQVQGNLTGVVEGDSSLTIQGNHTESVQGDYTKQINGNYSLVVAGSITESTSANWYRTAGGSTYDIASSTFNIDAGRINLG